MSIWSVTELLKLHSKGFKLFQYTLKRIYKEWVVFQIHSPSKSFICLCIANVLDKNHVQNLHWQDQLIDKCEQEKSAQVILTWFH